jgi:pantoate--beta-alanine ligase
MKIVRDILEMQNICTGLRLSRKKIGCVPTMGALHDGHLSLLHIARHQCDVLIVTLFVNPTQFDPKEDLQKYPRPFERDCEVAEKNGCDILFSPDTRDIYPDNYISYVVVENITKKLEGESRPGHFRGVTTIVLKLFNIIMPHLAVFGQKDAQQAIVLKRMVTDLNLPIELFIAPTIREKDGLALSSRNSYLTKRERAEVPLIYEGLHNAEQEHNRGELFAKKLVKHIRDTYKKTDLFKPEYIAIVDTENLEPVETISERTLIVVACRTKETNTRLIDNIILGGTL